MKSSRRSFLLPPLGPLLEHREHPIGHDEAADDVDRAEHDREESEQVADRAAAAPATSIAPTITIRGWRWRPHERRVQRRRHLGDDFEADEDRENEDVEPRRSLRRSCRDFLRRSRTFLRRLVHDFAVACVMTVPLITSSFMSRLSLPSFVIIRPSSSGCCASTSGWRDTASSTGCCVVPSMRNAVDVDDLAGLGELGVSACFGREVDDHRARLHRADHVGGDELRGRAAGDRAPW